MESQDRDHEPATEIMSAAAPTAEAAVPEEPERRFTAPSGFDAGATTRIDTPSEPTTEIMATAPAPIPKPVAPQVIPPRGDAPKPRSKRRSWGWVIALVLVIAALVAVAVLGTLLLTRKSEPSVPRRTRSARPSKTTTPRSKKATWPRCAASPAAPPGTTTSSMTTACGPKPMHG